MEGLSESNRGEKTGSVKAFTLIPFTLSSCLNFYLSLVEMSIQMLIQRPHLHTRTRPVREEVYAKEFGLYSEGACGISATDDMLREQYLLRL